MKLLNVTTAMVLAHVLTMGFAYAQSVPTVLSKDEILNIPVIKEAFEVDEDLAKKMVAQLQSEPKKGQLFFESQLTDVTSPISQYNTVIVINKSASGSGAQRLRMYVNGQLRETTKVSTGLENLEIVKKRKKFFRKVLNLKGTLESHWRHTPTGFYNMKDINGADYKSGESQFGMPYAMFFNRVNGIAVHAVPPEFADEGGNAALGSRASSGCVRVHRDIVQTIHSTIDRSGKGVVPSVNQITGQQNLNADGSLKYLSNAFRTIVVVEEI